MNEYRHVMMWLWWCMRLFCDQYPVTPHLLVGPLQGREWKTPERLDHSLWRTLQNQSCGPLCTSLQASLPQSSYNTQTFVSGKCTHLKWEMQRVNGDTPKSIGHAVRSQGSHHDQLLQGTFPLPLLRKLLLLRTLRLHQLLPALRGALDVPV